MKDTALQTLYTPEGEWLAQNPTEIPWDKSAASCESYYPRPQLKRDSFFNLNGEWELCVKAKDGTTLLESAVRVPFAPQAPLSGIGKTFPRHARFLYRKRFSLPTELSRENSRVILHFGAVDQIATVTLNGNTLGKHTGGYLPFSFDVTDALKSENELTVTVIDELTDYVLPYGKQCEKRGGMWYTPVSGIWQTVWIECVPNRYIQSLRINTGADFAELTVTGVCNGTVTLLSPTGEQTFALQNGKARITVEEPVLWSPENPHLYRFMIDAEGDRAESYFALRTLEIKTVGGLPRLCLNGSPYYFHGLLDQGYYSDGIYTPAAPVCYQNDILAMKKLGFNTLRKHIKIEPEVFYYECDRLGMIVFQDMVNNGRYSFLRDTALPTVGMKKFPDRLLHRSKRSRQAFLDAMEQTVNHLFNHPCICYWTIFNEGWGQFHSTAAYHAMKALDASRFIDTASGWFAGAPSDVISPHVYFKPVRIKPGNKPTLLSEFGGYSCGIREHVFNTQKSYGYRNFDNVNAFSQALEGLYDGEILPAISNGLCGDIYTQVSDVEDEINGLLTYDRRVQKVPQDLMLRIKHKIDAAFRETLEKP